MAGLLGAPNTGRVTTTAITAQGNETWQAFQQGFFRLPNLAEGVFERASVLDPTALRWNASTAVADGVALSELEPTFRVTLFEAVADALSLADSHAYFRDVFATLAYTLRISESFYITRPYARSASDTLRTGDTIVASPVGLAQDVAQLVDAAIPMWVLTLNEAIRAEDSFATQGYFQRTLSDPVRLRDSLLTAFGALAAEGITLSDPRSVVRALTVIDRLGIAEAALARASMGLTVAESARLLDSLRRFFGGDVVEGMTVTPLLGAMRRAMPLLSDAVALDDVETPRLVLRLTLPDSVVLDDAEALQLVFRPVLTDGVEIAAAYIQPGQSVTTWVMNARTTAVTEYDSFAFNSFAEIAPGRYIAASDDGVYELQGDDDDGAPIMARIKSGLMQFAGSRFVGLKAVYLGMRASGDFYLKIEHGGSTTTYQARIQNMETTKVNVGKGLRTRYLSFELSNKDGQDFDLDTVEFVPMWAQRRV